MSDYQRCPTCRKYAWFGASAAQFGIHKCAPLYECRMAWDSDDPDSWANVHAVDAEEAAEKYAERYDCDGGDYAIVSGKMRCDVIVQVRKPGDEAFEQWDIEAESVPEYRATKIDAPAEVKA